MSTKNTDQATGLKDRLIAYAHTHLPDREGVPAREMPTILYRPGHMVRSELADNIHGISEHFLALSHPVYGEYIARVRVEGGKPVQAHWEYDGENCEVNGVVFGSRALARRVRTALRDAGIPGVAVMHPDARRVLRDAGIL